MMHTIDDDRLLLFNHPKYHGLRLLPGQFLFRYDHSSEGRWIGSLVGVQADGEIVVGHQAPYGGPDVISPSETTTNIIGLIQNAIEAARRTGARTLRIRARPGYHSANDVAVLFALMNLGFKTESCEITQGISVACYASVEDYIGVLKASQRNQVRRGLRQSELWSPVDISGWSVGYQLLQLNRSFRGESLKFSFEYLLRLRAEFHNRISMYLLRIEGRERAAALVYRVRRNVDHVVAWGDDKTRRDIAPIGTLAVHLIERAIRANVGVLDIGVSSADGIPDEGLIAFKRHSLARVDLRMDFSLALG